MWTNRFSFRRSETDRRLRRKPFHPVLEVLENRLAPATFEVNSSADPGDGVCDARECTLREAIGAANLNPSTDNITFNIPHTPGSLPPPIAVRSALPFITDPVIIDATTQPDYGGRPLVVINGSSVPTQGTNGLVITAGSSTVRGLVISLFTGTGIVLSGGGNNHIEGNYIGTNIIGTLRNPNQGGGIVIRSSSNGNLIGGSTPQVRNIISGNGGHGITLNSASDNRIQGNYIGTTADGGTGLGNSLVGISLEDGCRRNVIGTDGDGTADLAERNVISANGWDGIAIQGSQTQSTIVAGNYIGTDVSGTMRRANGRSGIWMGNRTQSNRIGTNGDGVSDLEERNVISANSWRGIHIDGGGTNSHVVAGNYIGLNAAGTAALGNGYDGIVVSNGPTGNRIGIDHRHPGYLLERNVISSNNYHGVALNGANANIVAGNYIGTSATGAAGLGNLQTGVILINGANSNWIGTGGIPGQTDVAERNIIAANGWDGVQIRNSRNNRVGGNYIGTDVSGTRALGNGGRCNWPGCHGVSIWDGSQGNVIGVEGDASPGDDVRRNVISGNANDGVGIANNTTIRNVVAGNYIGTNAAGDQALTNGVAGVALNGAGQNRIGTNSDGIADDLERNVIGSNGSVIGGASSYGIFIAGAGATGNTVAGNYIGTDATGSVALGSPAHVYGVALGGGAVNNLIGGMVPAARNVISGNLFGVGFSGNGATGNQVQGNYIGTQADGVNRLGNLAHGVFFGRDASGNMIGGSVPEAGNVIAYSGGSGVVVASGTANVIRSNSVFANVGLGIDLGADGVTPNHETNPLPGPNNWQNYPTLSQAQEGATTWVSGDIVTAPNATLTLDFYASTVPDPTGYGQGERYLGALQVQTDENGYAAFGDFVGGETFAGEFVTATATGPDGTSEFSAAGVVEPSSGPRGGSGAALVPTLLDVLRRMPGGPGAAGSPLVGPAEAWRIHEQALGTVAYELLAEHDALVQLRAGAAGWKRALLPGAFATTSLLDRGLELALVLEFAGTGQPF